MQPVMRLMVAVRELTGAGASGLTMLPFGSSSVIGRKQPAFVGIAAGASAAPLNPAYRIEEFEFYLSDLNVITDTANHRTAVYPICTAPGPQFSPRISGACR